MKKSNRRFERVFPIDWVILGGLQKGFTANRLIASLGAARGNSDCLTQIEFIVLLARIERKFPGLKEIEPATYATLKRMQYAALKNWRDYGLRPAS